MLTSNVSSKLVFFYLRCSQVRSLTQEAKNWCQLMENPTATVWREVLDNKLIKLHLFDLNQIFAKGPRTHGIKIKG